MQIEEISDDKTKSDPKPGDLVLRDEVYAIFTDEGKMVDLFDGETYDFEEYDGEVEVCGPDVVLKVSQRR